jgi:hypothetical protein
MFPPPLQVVLYLEKDRIANRVPVKLTMKPLFYF